MELRQQLRLSQQLVMTPQLQQAIKLLQLSRLELVDAINQELEENPALDEAPEAPDERTSDTQDEPEVEASPEAEVKIDDDNIATDIDWDNYIGEYNSTGKIQFESEHREAPQYEAFIAGKKSIEDHLLWQLMMVEPSEDEKLIGNLIIYNLNEDGYLTATIEEIAELSGKSVEDVDDALFLMQSFDPPGICARSLQECLKIQARRLGIKDETIIKIIDNHINDLQNKNYKAISRALKVHINAVVAAVKIITDFESKPGQCYNNDEPMYITPDIYVYKEEGEFIVVLNDDGMPKLRINPYYQKAIKKGQPIATDTKSYLKDKMQSAHWLIKSIHQRQKTIYNVMNSILKFQREFFEKGISHLKPMVLADIANDIEMHESTISRVTTNKYAYTPQGIFELKFFFNSSISRVSGDAVASVSVHDKIRQIIEKENPKKPFSDEKISKLLKEENNIKIARRTVAKYREAMRILPSSKRKQY